MKTLLDQLIELHGDAVGRALYEIELTSRAKSRDQYLELQSKLTGINADMDAEGQAAAARQAPLEAEMNRLNKSWIEACEKLRAQQIADQGAILPLQERAAAIRREMNKSPFEGRIKQWVPVPPNKASRPMVG